jgi:hypothetical protein
MLQSAPTMISSASPRSTEPYHTLVPRPSVTCPTTTAPGATHASGWITGLTPSTDPIMLILAYLSPGKPDKAAYSAVSVAAEGASGQSRAGDP